MDYKTQSIITVVVLLGLMFAVGWFVSQMEGSVTGAAIAPACKCSSDSYCDDGNKCTTDICLYPESCQASLCVHDAVPDCLQ